MTTTTVKVSFEDEDYSKDIYSPHVQTYVGELSWNHTSDVIWWTVDSEYRLSFSPPQLHALEEAIKKLRASI